MARRAAFVALVLLASASSATAAGNPVAGKVVFKKYCGTCHTFAAAATVGKGASRGPILTNKSITQAVCRKVITGMSAGMMPSFLGTLTPTQIADVTAFVVAASKPGYVATK